MPTVDSNADSSATVDPGTSGRVACFALRWATLHSAIICIGMTTGCRTDQAADVRDYRSITDFGSPPPLPAASAPLSLRQAVMLANTYNESLGVQGEAYIQALAERQRRGALLLPTISLFADSSIRENTGGSTGRNAAFDTGLTLQYTLFTGLTDFNRASAADSLARVERWLLLDLREVLMQDTARSYYEVLRAERLIEVLESSVALQTERLRDVRGRQSVGFARPLDVAQIEAQASQTRVSLLDARNQRDNARAALAFLTGAETGMSPLTDGFSPPQRDLSLPDMIEQAHRDRQDLHAAHARADAARAEVDAAVGRYYPSVALDLDAFLSRDTGPTDLDLASIIRVNLPLFSAGEIEADVRSAWSVFRESVLNYSLTRRRIAQEVETALTNYDVSVRRVEERRTQVTAAQEALRQAEASYQAGLGTNLERIAAQDQLLNAQLGAASEEFIRKFTYIALLRAMGTLSVELAGATPEPIDAQQTAPPTSPVLRLPTPQPAITPEGH